jgi:hypothetical protein
VSTTLDPSHVAWCGRHFSFLAEGGVWAVPRSGLVFQRRGDTLVLIESMPWMPEMEGIVTPAELDEQQACEYDQIRNHMRAAGVKVTRR